MPFDLRNVLNMVGMAFFCCRWRIARSGRWVGGWGWEGKGGCGGGGVFVEPTWEECSSWVIGQGVCVNDRFSIFVCLDGWSSCQVLVPQSRFPPSKPQLKSSFPPHTHAFLSRQLFNLRSFLDAPPLSPPLSSQPPSHLHRSLIRHTQPHTLNEESSPRS